MDIPQFETKRLILKGVQTSDFLSYQKHFDDYEVIRHLSAGVPWPFPKDGVADFVNKVIFPRQGKDRWLWGIFLKENPLELIGAVDLWRNGIPENRGFWLGRKFWGQGLMTEAVVPVTAYAFEILGFEKLIFSNAVGNKKSHRIKEKTGAKLIGTEPAKFVDPLYTEREIWEFTKAEWKNADTFFSNEFTIEPMKREHLTDVTTLAAQLGYKVTNQDLEKRFTEISDHAAYALFVARSSSNEILGWIQINAEPKTLLRRPSADVAALIVDEKHRGKKIGAALLKQAEGWAEENKLNTIRIRSNVTRERAHRFYQREKYNLVKSWHLFVKEDANGK